MAHPDLWDYMSASLWYYDRCRGDFISAQSAHDVHLRVRRWDRQLGEWKRRLGAGQGKTENALMRLPFKAYAIRPGAIQPLHGIRSKTTAYRVLYGLTKLLLPVLRWAFRRTS